MDRLGFDVQVIYPTLFLIYLTDNVALEVALYRAYNRWLAEACAKGKERLRWVVIPPLRSIEESNKEIRWAKDRGAAGVFFRGIEGNLTLDNPYFFPVYQAASDLDLPICIHQGSGSPTFINFFNLDETANGPIPRFCRSLRSTTSSTIKSPSCFHVSNSASSKPTPVGFPICLHSFKRQFRGEWKYSSSADLFRDYRIYVACETEENLPALAHCIGEDNLLIGSDYGHNDPFEQRNFLPTLRSQNGIPSRVVEKMVRDNPCTFYGLQKDQEAAVVKMRGMIVVQA